MSGLVKEIALLLHIGRGLYEDCMAMQSQNLKTVVG